MLSVTKHGGPDDRGTLCCGNLTMGMQRLSIVDLVGGKQPLFNEDRKTAIVFNGEIYNYR